jgi:hypothetical protein
LSLVAGAVLASLELLLVSVSELETELSPAELEG